MTYFPSQSRSDIMESARLHRLLRFMYDGLARIIEPYALVSKRRKDGVAREYLYGWDLRGGRSGDLGYQVVYRGQSSFRGDPGPELRVAFSNRTDQINGLLSETSFPPIQPERLAHFAHQAGRVSARATPLNALLATNAFRVRHTLLIMSRLTVVPRSFWCNNCRFASPSSLEANTGRRVF